MAQYSLTQEQALYKTSLSQVLGTPRLDLEFQRPDQQWLWIFKMTDRADERGQKERRKEATKLPGEHRTSTWRNSHGRRKWGVVNHSIKWKEMEIHKQSQNRGWIGRLREQEAATPVPEE